MESKFKAMRFALLMSAIGGMSVLFLSASSPAEAGEQRLHTSSKKTYGLIAIGEGGRSGRASDTTTGNTVSKSASSSGGSMGNKEPQLEDPALPAYNGGGAPSMNAG